jgi:ubiquinone/menaquinone biosynthesis C-methylase UbiE
MEKKILDACCGSKMMWFDKNNPNVTYADIRKGEYQSHGVSVTVNPCVISDFRKMPFSDESFYHVVIDPPHSKWLNENTIMGVKYGKLLPTWKEDIKLGFDEAMRVLKPNGTLIFKWATKEIKLSQLLSVLKTQPLYGHTSGKHGKTIWLCFMKIKTETKQ